MASSYQVFARKYRPQRFSDVVGQEAVVSTLKNSIRLGKVAHAYLFAGSRGIGKTTLARLFAKAINCAHRSVECEPCNECPSCKEILSGQSLDVIEIDGASNRGIEDIRKINETVGYAPTHGQCKIYIIDEVHMLTKEAFNALLKTLEEPPRNVKFFFATTEPHKILATILSRCHRFDLRRISETSILEKLQTIAHDLGRNTDPLALSLIASFAEGSLRDAESLFDQILCWIQTDLKEEDVRTFLGLVPEAIFEQIDKAFSTQAQEVAFTIVETLFQEGKDLFRFFTMLLDHYRKLTLVKLIGPQAIAPLLRARYERGAALYTPFQLSYLFEYLLKEEQPFQKSLSPRIALEAILLHILQSKNKMSLEEILHRLEELEKKLPSPTPPQSPALETTPFLKTPSPLSSSAQEEEPGDTKPILKKPPSPPPAPVPASFLEEEPVDNKPFLKEPSSSPVSFPLKHPSHYDTLIRFAAIELEGTIEQHRRSHG